MSEDQNRTFQDKFMLRLPPGMREQIRDFADALGRSMNGEIVHRLRRSLDEDKDDRFERVYLPRSLWTTLNADAHLRGISEFDRLIQILENTFSNTPDLETNVDKLYEVYGENVRITDENAQLREEADVFFALYFGKIIQLSQFAKLVIGSGDHIPSLLRKAADEIEELNGFEMRNLENRSKLAQDRQALRENKTSNASEDVPD